jgi:DNA-binding CsgD family transcriptional regulator
MASDSSEEILARLDTLIRLQALSVVSRLESSKEKIAFLGAAGMEVKQIADLLGTTANSVSVTLFKARKGKARKIDRRT